MHPVNQSTSFEILSVISLIQSLTLLAHQLLSLSLLSTVSPIAHWQTDDRQGAVVDLLNRVWEAPPVHNVVHQSHDTMLFVGMCTALSRLNYSPALARRLRWSDLSALCSVPGHGKSVQNMVN